MRTNIEIDDALMKEAMEAMGVRTKREAVHEALTRAVSLQRQGDAIRALRGTGWVGDLEATRLD